MGLFDPAATVGSGNTDETVDVYSNQLNTTYQPSSFWGDKWPHTGDYQYPYFQYTYGCTCPSKITLKYSEIELLRRLVANNKEAKDILNKFSGNIHVEVDF